VRPLTAAEEKVAVVAIIEELRQTFMQNDTLFGILCHLAYGHFAHRYRLDATKLCVNLPISVGQMRQNLFQHLSHSAYKIG
jgi:hypothetical protein